MHAHDVVVLLVTNGQRFAGLDGAAVLEHGAVGCRQGGYLAEYFVHTVPVDGVVDMLERVNIRATQGKWCLGTIDVRPHLSCLRGCGLVVATYEGRQVRYALADSHLARALGELVQVVLAVDTDQPCVAERAASGEAVEMTGS